MLQVLKKPGIGSMVALLSLAAFWTGLGSRYQPPTGESPGANVEGNSREILLKQAVLDSMYQIEGDRGTLVANNRAHDMQGRFDGEGLFLRSTENSDWEFSWRLRTIGYGDRQEPVSSGELIKRGHQVEIRRDQGLIEWYKNSTIGLEHGFKVSKKPFQADGDHLLRLVMHMDGDMMATTNTDGLGVTLATSSGKQLIYDKLKAWDSDGKILTSAIRAETAQQVFIEVDDKEAVYPITIDPTFAQAQKIMASDASPNAYFGWELALEENTAVVKAGDTDSNAEVYILVWNGVTWIEQQKLVSPDAGSNEFGESIAISGDTLVVGAPEYDISNTEHGTAYVYTRSGSTWQLRQTLLPSFGEFGRFGSHVAVYQNKIAVGHPGREIGGGVIQSAVKTYSYNGTNWSLEATITPSDQPNFASSVSIHGNTLVVGASLADIGQSADQGATYVFINSGTTWSQQQKLIASDGASGDQFGTDVSYRDDRVAIGAPMANITEDSPTGTGAVYVFIRTGTTWIQEPRLLIPEASSSNRLGFSSSIDNDTVIAGSTNEAHVFRKEDGVWIRRQKVKASDGGVNDHFGQSVAISGKRFIVGAPDHNQDRGAVYFFRLNRPVADFDGDGKTDISVFRPSTSEWLIYASGGGSLGATFGLSTDRLVPADFTGDAKDDVAIWRPSTGDWWILRSENSTAYTFPFGQNGDVPMINDFDGDGKADAGIYRPSNSTWYVSKSSGGLLSQVFGASGDTPIAADYDGDAKADLAVFRPSTGNWIILASSTATQTSTAFGASTDKLVPWDYTGDNRADLAFWRPSTGEWFVLRSENATYYSFPFGLSTDLPVPGDYDGDGKYDTAVFRPSTSTWWVEKSTGGTLAQTYGISGDKPVPNIFVP